MKIKYINIKPLATEGTRYSNFTHSIVEGHSIATIMQLFGPYLTVLSPFSTFVRPNSIPTGTYKIKYTWYAYKIHMVYI